MIFVIGSPRNPVIFISFRALLWQLINANHNKNELNFYYFISLFREKNSEIKDISKFSHAFILGGIDLCTLEEKGTHWKKNQIDPSRSRIRSSGGMVTETLETFSTSTHEHEMENEASKRVRSPVLTQFGTKKSRQTPTGTPSSSKKKKRKSIKKKAKRKSPNSLSNSQKLEL